MSARVRIVLWGVLFFGAGVVCAAAPADDGQNVFLVSSERSHRGIDSLVRAAGGAIVAVAPEAGVALVHVDERGLVALRGDRRTAAAARGFFSPGDLAQLSGRQREFAGAWQRKRLLEASPSFVRPVGSPLINDTVLQQFSWQEEAPPGQWSASIAAGTRPYGATEQNTSEYLAGRVSINLLLLESAGPRTAASEDWDATKEAQILAETLSAADSLVSLHPDANLQFVVHPYYGRTDPRLQTNSEPIAYPADPGDRTTGVREDTWTKEVLANLGYSSGSRTYRSRLFADATRVQDGAAWAVNVFVINSFRDVDGMFSDGYFAYAYVGGPHVVVTYDNDGWGVINFDRVLAHELHHSFFALDEYASSGCSCSAASGYLAAANVNCEVCTSSPAPCAMRDNRPAVCQSTRQQVGTVDTDADGTPDILQTPPGATVQLTSDPACGGPVGLGGSAEVGRRLNQNPTYATPPNNISILSIAGVEHRVDHGAWRTGVATADDGAFDGPLENYSLELSLLPGSHTVEVRAVDTRGNRSAVEELSMTVAAGRPAGAVGNSLRVTPLGDAVTLNWDAAAGAAAYRVRRAPSPSSLAKAAPIITISTTTWSDTAPGTAFYEVTSANSCGAETP